MKKYKIGLIQAVIVLLPTYLVAYMTDKMVYTIPMLAAASFVAASFSKDTTCRTNRSQTRKSKSKRKRWQE